MTTSIPMPSKPVWVLIVSLLTLGCAEYYNLDVLFWFAAILAAISTMSFLFIMIA